MSGTRSKPAADAAPRLRAYLIRLLRTAALALLFGAPAHAETTGDERQVAAAVEDYLQGSSYSRADRLRRAFHPDARLYLDQGTDGMREVSIADYIGWFGKNPGQFNGRIGRLLSTQVDGHVATAKAEVLIGKDQARFVDLFLLKKIGGQWQIVSKTATRQTAPAHGRQVLLVVSNVAAMPGTQLSAGNSFSELIHAYAAFRAAGYGVQFVSPEGGAVPLAYIDTRYREHMAMVYDRDFMWMFGIADDPALKALAVRLYERHDGIVSAVCHGSAGLVDLTLSDGTALVGGKRVTGYPDAFEDKRAAYYKSFPFSIEQRLQSRKGLFRHGARNTSHVEIDGRLITGMNWQSTRDVVAAIIAKLETATAPAPVAATPQR
jgi:putative intracellular protease/amidase